MVSKTRIRLGLQRPGGEVNLLVSVVQSPTTEHLVEAARLCSDFLCFRGRKKKRTSRPTAWFEDRTASYRSRSSLS